jgi:hypothetical protein
MGLLIKKQNPAPVVKQEINLPFDYGDTAPDAVKKIEAAAKAFHAREVGARKIAMEYAVEQGRLLHTVKERLEHGQFLKWIDKRLGVSDQTARNYMGAVTLADKSQTVLDLPVATVYKLAAPNTPSELQQEIIAKLESDDKPDPHEIVAEIDAAKKKIATEKAEAAKAKYKLEKKTAGKSKEDAAKIAKQQAAYQKKKKAAEAKEAAKLKAQREAREKAATDALKLIVNGKLSHFAELLETAGTWNFHEAVKKAVKGAG